MRKIPHSFSGLPNLLTLGLLALIAANYFSPLADLDWSWQIRTGEEIVRTRNLRVTDSFSYTIHGSQVPDFEWLYEVTLWAVWDIFGMGGLKFLRVLMVALPLILVGWHLHHKGLHWHVIFLVLTLAVVVVSPAWNLRPLYCTTIGLLLVWMWLHELCQSPLNKDGTCNREPALAVGSQLNNLPTKYYFLPLVMLLWSNLHPGVITGQGLIAGAIGWEWLNRWLKINPPLDGARLRRLTLVGGAGLLATFISPDPLERLRYPFKPELAHPIMRIFTEMQPTLTFITQRPFSIGLVYLVALLVLGSVVLRFRHYRGWELALLGGTALLGNFAFRSLQDWLLVMLALGTPHLAILLAGAARRGRRRWWVAGLLRVDFSLRRILHAWPMRLQPVWLGGAVGLLLVVSLIPPLSRRMPIQESREWPTAAADHIEKSGLQGRFFAPPNFGAYLGWRLGERAKIYTDTRGFFFPPLLLEDSVLLPQLSSDWQGRLQRVLHEYGTDYFLLETRGARGALWQSVKPFVGEPLFLDESTVLLSAGQLQQGISEWSHRNSL